MSATLLNGAALARQIRDRLRGDVESFTRDRGRAPALHIVLAGDDAASQIYVRNKERAGAEAGLEVVVHRLDATTPGEALLALVARLNDDAGVDGILVQAPLPPAMGPDVTRQVFDAIDPARDVDGFHPHNVGLLSQGRATLAPCTPSGVIALLEHHAIPLAGAHAVVIGRSDIVGKPMAMMLLQRHATVTICHSRTRDLGRLAAGADVLVAALGRAGFVTPDMVRRGATVIDVGINRVTDRAQAEALVGAGSPRMGQFEAKGALVVGDVHPAVAEVAGAMTPVPGGVGPLTVAMLQRNTLAAALSRS